MSNNISRAAVFVTVLGMTTLGVAATQYGGAQPDKTKQQTNTKPHTMTGCLEKGADATMFRLTNVEGTGPKTVELHADASKKLSAHVGHKVAITGTDVDPKTLKKGTTGKAEPKPEAGAAATEEHHMRVTSLKHVAETCS